MEIVPLTDVLEHMAQGQPCTITFVTCDRKRKKGGEIRTYEQCTQIGKNYQHSIRRVKLVSGKLRDVHIRLITHFNGKKVIY